MKDLSSKELKNLLAPCGLYCGVCGIYYATKNNNDKLRKKLAKAYWCKKSSINCNGCLSDNRFFFCKTCKIRNCVMEKKISGCHECDDFPCKFIEQYPYNLAKEYMLISTQVRRNLRNDELWIRWEEENWKCKNCGEITFRGAKRCPKCKEEIKSPAIIL